MWEHYASLEPFDQKRADYRAASIVQAIANVFRGKKTKPVTLDDAVLRFGEDAEKKPKQSQQEQLNILTILSKMQAYAVANRNDKTQG